MIISKIKHNPKYRAIIEKVNEKYPVLVAKLRFRLLFGKKLDLKNPKDLNEKILWLSLYSDITQWSIMADKYRVRDYVKETIGDNYLVKLWGKWDSVKDINWNLLPAQFVLKSNNGSGTVKIVRDKSKLDLNKTIEQLNQWLNHKIARSTTEFHYDSIKPCIIAEEYLDFTQDPNNTTSVVDYKIWCFNGKAYYIWACKNRDVGMSTEVALFDREWNYHPELSVFNEHYREQKEIVVKPKNLDEMLSVAEKLSRPFPIVRVDMYNLNGKIYFGEMTFTSLGGTMDFYTQDCLNMMGSLADISKIKKVRNL